jgi:hypothetical protein
MQNKQPFLRELCACSTLFVLIFVLSCRVRIHRLSAAAERVIRNVGKGSAWLAAAGGPRRAPDHARNTAADSTVSHLVFSHLRLCVRTQG